MDGLIDARPTFYEMMLLDSYRDLVTEGFRHCIRVIINRFDSLVSLRYHSDKITTLLVALLDLMNFWKHKASFAESFSGLGRVFG